MRVCFSWDVINCRAVCEVPSRQRCLCTLSDWRVTAFDGTTPYFCVLFTLVSQRAVCFSFFLVFFCWMTIQQCVCELTWNYTKTNYSTQFHLPQTNHTTSCEPRHPEYAQIVKCLLAAYKRGEFIAARGQRRDGAAQREARVQKWKGHRWRDEVIWRRNESEVIYA